jgi:hypothetical protein
MYMWIKESFEKNYKKTPPSPNWECHGNTRHKFSCKGTPESVVKDVTKFPRIRVTKAFAQEVMQHKVTTVTIPIRVTDAQGHTTVIDEKISPH